MTVCALPSSDLHTSAVRAPWLDASMAARRPAPPAPMTTTSNSCDSYSVIYRNLRSVIVPLATRRTYTSARATENRLSQAYSACLALSLDTLRHSQARLGALESASTWPPHRWRHEWHDSVYSHSSATLTSSTVVPTPTPKPSGNQNARSASQVRMSGN